MHSRISRLLLVGAVAAGIVAACTIERDDLATKSCTSNADCPGGYQCTGAATSDAGVGRCELIFPIRPPGFDAGVPDAGTPTYYCSEAKPIIDTYCVSCHGQLAPQLGVRLDVYDTGNGNGVKPHAERVKYRMSVEQTMPPLDSGQPTADERETVAKWFDTGAQDCFAGFDASVPLLDDGGLPDGGGTPPDSGTPDGGGGPPDAGLPYVKVQAVWNAYCTGSGCHSGAAPAGSLNLTAGASYGNLVNVNTTCNTAVKRVATTGTPIDSMLWRKISANSTRCGGVMPTSNALVNVDQTAFDTVEEWIKEGAKNL